MSAKEYISDEVLARYLAGTADAGEIGEVSEWLEGAPGRSAELDAYRTIWMCSRQLGTPLKEADTDAAWAKVKEKMGRSAKAEEETRPLPARRPGFRLNYWNAAAVVLVALSLGWLLFRPAAPAPPLTFSTEGNMKEVDLPDGSRVFLNHHSSVSFQEGLPGRTRALTLRGEAFFEVAPDAARPFLVTAGEVGIRVLGTSFNVKAYGGASPLRVDVQEGKVEVRRQQQKVLLTRGQSARLGSDSVLTTTGYDENEMAYHTGIYDFKANTLAEVADILGRGFHTEIRLPDPGLASCHYTARFEKQPLDVILHILAESLHLKVTRGDGHYLLTGAGCR